MIHEVHEEMGCPLRFIIIAGVTGMKRGAQEAIKHRPQLGLKSELQKKAVRRKKKLATFDSMGN